MNDGKCGNIGSLACSGECAARANIGVAMEEVKPLPTLHDLLEISERMAQDLQDYVTEGEQDGSEMTVTKELLAEFDELYKRLNNNSDDKRVTWTWKK